MANQHKDDANQNQHTNKAMAAGAGANAGAHQPDMENMNSPENLGGERPNPSNTRPAKQETGERLDLKSDDDRSRQSDR
ncbi:MAG TPA: hypothetical protein VN228_07270 [Pyrinomonadaceae bacterium]|nr:hypothetical protein [Pyrinomonadaceae bacterium]